jgi:hypothetical protein
MMEFMFDDLKKKSKEYSKVFRYHPQIGSQFKPKLYPKSEYYGFGKI